MRRELILKILAIREYLILPGEVNILTVPSYLPIFNDFFHISFHVIAHSKFSHTS